MISPYKIQPNIIKKLSKKVSNTNFDNNSHREHDLERPQLTSNDLVEPDTNTESIVKRLSNKRNKSSLKDGSTHKDIEINGEYLDEILNNSNL